MKTETPEYAFAMLDQNGSYTQYGLTKREYFASKVLHKFVDEHGPVSACEQAIQYADELISQLNK